MPRELFLADTVHANWDYEEGEVKHITGVRNAKTTGTLFGHYCNHRMV